MKNKTIWKRVLIGVIAVPIVALMVFQIASLSFGQVSTETVFQQTVEQTVKTTLFVLRDEQYLQNNVTGTVVPLIEDGGRVAKGDAVAAICSNTSDAVVLARIDDLKADILRYENLSAQKNTSPAIDKLNKDIDALFLSMLGVISSGELETLEKSTVLLRDKLTSRQIAIEGPPDFSEKIAQLKKQLAALEGANPQVTALTTDLSGYLINHIDGYEKTLDYNKAGQLSVADVERAIASAAVLPGNNAVGKIVSDYNWYLAGVINSLDAARLKVGTVITIRTTTASETPLRVRVHAVNAGDGGKSAVVFLCNQMNKRLAGMRIETAEIVLEEHKGLKINSEAVRVVDGVTGIYILRGNVVSFRKIQIAYAGEGYVVAKSILNNSDTTPPLNAELYDEAIIKGKDLYEGKLVS